MGEVMGTESSDEHPKVKSGGTERLIRRWEDKAVAVLGIAVVGLVCWMWQGLSAQISKLEEAKNSLETKVAVQHSELSGLKAQLTRIEEKLDEALRKK